ncbi:MAG: ATP-dependent Clp protease, ATP-binding subunit clpA [Myxococcales bacterium]|nr:ATP-dependent Clp protease, ATP-binding subunit clpA [Myxococcales bacterium]
MTISKELESTIQTAFDEARKRRHEFVTLEHVLFALTKDPVAIKILKSAGADLKKLQKELETFFSENMPELPEGVEREPQQTAAFWRALQRAAMHVQSSGKEFIDGGNLLVAFYRERDSHAVWLLEQQGVKRLDVLNFIAHGISKKDREDAASARREVGPDEEGDAVGDDDEGGEPEDDPLQAYTVNFVEKAAAGRIDPLIGRKAEVERAIQVLARRRKNNPIFVGEPGVGKTAIVEGIAKAIFEGSVPSVLQDHVIYSLDMGALLAGTKFRGQFEERLKGVIKAIVKDEKAILFIDEIHTIVGAGATAGGSMDASNILKPQLASGELRCIGSTTFQEYKQHFDRDRALARRFQKIEVHEPTVDETVEILRGLKTQYEKHHDVIYTDEGLQAAAKLAAKFINDRMLPDKAIDVIDEAGAVDKLKVKRLKTLGPREIEEVVAKMAKIPSASVSASDEVALKQLDPQLKKVIYGQDRAIDALVASIKLSRSGLAAADKPIGSFLFSGPTGVGKTELAKQLAKVMGVEFLRFDMTEYMEKHTVSRLIGAPPGYVGFDQGGLLTDAVRKTPHAVVVLDEIEKAHPDIYNILLQVMDHATLTDNNGRKADFRHVVIIMTTNAGAREMSARKPGFDFSAAIGGKAAAQDHGKQAIERTFAPEFRNRLDAWISFEALPAEVIRKVVDKLVGELTTQLVEKKVHIELSPEARDWLAEHGFDAQFGARPMARLIQTELKKPLADELLFGRLRVGGKVRVEVADGKIVLRYPE